ncbi:hypothetical protein BDZ94DRAFT_1236125 [Collybia nuda]|uniref:Uncharacterized protein n=1 Tax=Collybia nuda TaxID=64659 RepID=A0A9P5Y542_9AGAR|nr:hypothetical protein BDZ94DRAFT_1236125 [Collybia nuda]
MWWGGEYCWTHSLPYTLTENGRRQFIKSGRRWYKSPNKGIDSLVGGGTIGCGHALCGIKSVSGTITKGNGKFGIRVCNLPNFIPLRLPPTGPHIKLSKVIFCWHSAHVAIVLSEKNFDRNWQNLISGGIFAIPGYRPVCGAEERKLVSLNEAEVAVWEYCVFQFTVLTKGKLPSYCFEDAMRGTSKKDNWGLNPSPAPP